MLLLLISTCFQDVLVYLYCLMNRDIWWGIFELIFVPSAENSKRCAYILSFGVSLQSGPCRACFFTGNNIFLVMRCFSLL
jgi:hypothetical protein